MSSEKIPHSKGTLYICLYPTRGNMIHKRDKTHYISCPLRFENPLCCLVAKLAGQADREVDCHIRFDLAVPLSNFSPHNLSPPSALACSPQKWCTHIYIHTCKGAKQRLGSLTETQQPRERKAEKGRNELQAALNFCGGRTEAKQGLRRLEFLQAGPRHQHGKVIAEASESERIPPSVAAPCCL